MEGNKSHFVLDDWASRISLLLLSWTKSTAVRPVWWNASRKSRSLLTAAMLSPRPCIDKIGVGAAEDGPTVVAFAPVSGISLSTWPVAAGAESVGSGDAGLGYGTGGQSTPIRRLKVAVGSR